MDWLIALIGKLKLHMLGAFIALTGYLLLEWLAPGTKHSAVYAALLYLAVHIFSDQWGRRAIRIRERNRLEENRQSLLQWQRESREAILACSETVRRGILQSVKNVNPTLALYRPEERHVDLNRLARADVLEVGLMGLPRIHDGVFEELLRLEKSGDLHEFLDLAPGGQDRGVAQDRQMKVPSG
jgi:hypothetical protein